MKRKEITINNDEFVIVVQIGSYLIEIPFYVTLENLKKDEESDV